MAERDLVVRFIGDDRSLNQAFTRQERRGKQFETRTATIGRNLQSAFAGAGIVLGAQQIAPALEATVSAASDLNEQIDKSRVIFGDSSAAVEKWSETTASSIGISQRAALSAAGTFGGLFKTLDIAPDKAAELSESLVKLAADFASLNNTSPEDALVAIRSGLIGEAEPLRRYNVRLSEARVQQVAMEQTGKKLAKSLTDQEKVMARLAIIFDDGSIAQDNFANTSDSLANKQRILRAETDDLATSLGTALVPAADFAVISLTALVGSTNDLIGALKGIRSEIRDSDFFEGFNKKVDAAASSWGGWMTDLVNSIPILGDARRAVRGLGDESQSASGVFKSIADEVDAAINQLKDSLTALPNAAENAEKRFTTSIKGLQLKLKKAQISPGLGDDLSVLQEIERRIKRRIRAEGRTFELENQLVDVQLQIQSVRERLAANQSAAAREADAAEQQAADDANRAAENRQRRLQQKIQGDQFRALGLTSEGDERTPGVGALRKRAASLRNRIKGTALDTEATRNELKRITKVLSGAYGKVGKEVRDAILAMLDEIASGFTEGSKKVDKAQGPLTKTSSLNSRKIVEGLGLSQEEQRALRARLSNFNSAGIGLAGGQTSTTGRLGAPAPVEVESHITINIDGKKIASVVTRQQQKGARRNPRQKRGPNRRGNDA